ncbi:MAG: hypothetical protein ACQESA_00415 [Patescibacteria group bacterium]
MKEGTFKGELVIGRIVISLLLVFFVVLTPWWLYVSLLVFFIFFFSRYYEALFLGVLIDSLYGPSVMLHFPAFFTVSIAILLVISISFRGKLFR